MVNMQTTNSLTKTKSFHKSNLDFTFENDRQNFWDLIASI